MKVEFLLLSALRNHRCFGSADDADRLATIGSIGFIGSISMVGRIHLNTSRSVRLNIIIMNDNVELHHYHPRRDECSF